MSVQASFFSLEDPSQGIARELAAGQSTRIFVGDQSMLSVVRFEPHAQRTIRDHPEEQWGVLLQGSGARIRDGEEVPVRAGDFWRTPSRVSHGFIAGADGARVLDVFSPPREAYKKPGAGFAAGG